MATHGRSGLLLYLLGDQNLEIDAGQIELTQIYLGQE